METALVIGGAFITGSTNALGKADEKTPINDSWLTSKSKIALLADARVKGSEINVEPTQSAMMIRGKVDTDAAKQATEGIAKGIDGVKSVKNEWQVVVPSKREAIDDKDEAITTRGKAQIVKDSPLMKASIHNQTDAGVVAERRSAECPDQCPSIMDCLAGPGREVGEERSYGEGEDLRPWKRSLMLI